MGVRVGVLVQCRVLVLRIVRGDEYGDSFRVGLCSESRPMDGFICVRLVVGVSISYAGLFVGESGALRTKYFVSFKG